MISRAEAVLGEHPPTAYETVEDAPEDFEITRIESTGYAAWIGSVVIGFAVFAVNVALSWLLVDQPSLENMAVPWQMSLIGFGIVACIAGVSWLAAPRILISPRDNVFEYGRKSYPIDELAMTRVCKPEIRILRNWTEVLVLAFTWAPEVSRLRLPEIADQLNTAILWRERHHAALASLERSKQPGGPFRGQTDTRRQS